MPHQGEDDSPGQGGSNAPSQDPQHQGDGNARFEAQQHESDCRCLPSKGGQTSPSSDQPLYVQCGQTKSLRFPKCGHVITGDLLRDFSTAKLEDCPVCEVQPIPSGQSNAAKARPSETAGSRDESKSSAVHDRTKIHNERSRVTLRKYHNPAKWNGATEEFYVTKEGRLRRRVEPQVWEKMTKREQKRFLWSINVQSGMPAGEKSQKPTNPGNPNHPDYHPSSTASTIRRSHTNRPNPEAIKADIKKLLGSRTQNVTPHKNRSRRGQAVSVSAPPASPANQANVTGIESIETTASASRAHEEDLMSFKSSDTARSASNRVGNEAGQARSANSGQPDELISLGDTETQNTPRNVQTRPSLSEEIREQLSQLDL